VQWCGAERHGHGVRIIGDIVFELDGAARLGRPPAVLPGNLPAKPHGLDPTPALL
jgi:hypothetical protein